MRRQVIISGLVFTLMAGCASVRTSNLNPLNWFGGSEPVQVKQVTPSTLPTLAPRKGYPQFVDTRPLAPVISDLTVVKSASGAIVTATTTLPSTGYYDAELVRVASTRPDILTYEYRLRVPSQTTPKGTPAQRKLTAARSLSESDLAGIRTIVVQGAAGARQVRR